MSSTNCTPTCCAAAFLLREIDETIRNLDDGTEDGRLAQRLCGLIFLIRKLPREKPWPTSASAPRRRCWPICSWTICRADGTRLARTSRASSKKLVDCRQAHQARRGIQPSDSREQRMGTRVPQPRVAGLNSDLAAHDEQARRAHRRDLQQRAQGHQARAGQEQGASQAAGSLRHRSPGNGGQGHPRWVRDGWGEEEKALLSTTRGTPAGQRDHLRATSPRPARTTFKKAIVEYEAAKSTLEFKGTPTTTEGREARIAMETRWPRRKTTRDRSSAT